MTMSRPSTIRTILLSIPLLLSSLPSRADNHYRPHISVGAHGGVTLSEVTFSPTVKQKFLQGYTMGASFTYAEERHVGLRGEINLTQRGWSEDFEEHPFSFSRSLTYVELPIMTHIFFGPRTFKFHFNLGPQIGYMLSESTSANFDYHDPGKVPGFPNINRYTEQYTAPIHTRFDYGITAGFGISAIIRKRHAVNLEGRLYYGLGNIFPATKRDTFGASRNLTIAITLGYTISLR